MRHGLFTLALAAALTACSKPNPLFLDTWGGLSEGSSQASAETTDEPTATEPTTQTPTSVDPTTTTTTVDETTTAGPTATSSPATSTTGTTGQACSSQKIELLPLRDTFVVESTDVGNSCTLDGVNDEVFAAGKCRYLEFGGAQLLSLFRGTDIDETDRFSAYLLDFPRDDAGQLVWDNETIPLAAIEKVSLRIGYSDPGGYGYDAAVVDVYMIPSEFEGAKGEWLEGSGVGDLCSEGSNFDCATCKPGNPPPCEKTWFGLQEFAVPPAMFKLGSVELPITGKDGHTALLELDPALFGGKPNNGFVVVMQGLVSGMQIIVDTPPGPLRLHAKEYADANARPGLVVEACL